MKINEIMVTLMRVVLGIIMMAHGITKFQMGLDNVSGWFASIGIPGFLGYFVAALELVGGILLIIGLFTRYVSVLFAFMLIGATISVKLPGGLLGDGQGAGYELDLALLVISLYFAGATVRGFGLDQLLFRKKEQ
ncbi:DoxX family protein [Paenibacillus sp. ACRRX]|uniref:DoxX family protein n=1 Tax=Paenibacillus sp. ACRRX TaxID=2918206 RepID=UPI001EF742DD|nr:DoxX family protein [Paenibacillus sp. ACRRX]MCG7408726.1 DoxX family protein [Paenibacillus sp. ACRRX]